MPRGIPNKTAKKYTVAKTKTRAAAKPAARKTMKRGPGRPKTKR